MRQEGLRVETWLATTLPLCLKLEFLLDPDSLLEPIILGIDIAIIIRELRIAIGVTHKNS